MTTLTEKKWNIETSIEAPLHWRKPRRVWITGDLFHDGHDDNLIDRVFAVMALSPQHTFMVLTKRSKRMRNYLEHANHRHPGYREIATGIDVAFAYRTVERCGWPLPNVMIGVTAENQKCADERIPDLLATPAAKRFVSIEPMLGPVDLRKIMKNGSEHWDALNGEIWRAGAGSISSETWRGGNKLDLVICGGESGIGARPMHPDWARSLRDQCKVAGAAFFFKQWGVWDENVRRVGKASAGRLLDGVEHNGEVG